MKTSRFLNLMIVSLVVMAYTSCSNSDDVIDTPDPIVKTYTMSIEAQKGSNGTRALDLDENTLNSTWTAGEIVKVYKDDAELGTLIAQGDGASTSLKGTLTGELSVNDKLTLKYLSPNYNSQTGTIASISENCDYSTATVTVSGIADGNISTTNANFENQQAVIKFTLKNADGSLLLTPTSFRMTDGTSTVTLTIPLTTYADPNNGSGVIYVAFPASDASATITLSATAGDAVYGFGKTGITFEKGKYYGVTVKMKEIPVLNGKFTVNASGDQIRFSPGNLQYTKSASTWSFMDHQYSTVETYGLVGDDYANKDVESLFGWGTSNQTIDNYGSAYQPWSTVATGAYYGPKGEYNLTGTYANGDWGVNMGSGWRTLTKDEWLYLFGMTANNYDKSGHARYRKYFRATVNGVIGIVVLPDDINGISNIPEESSRGTESTFAGKTYTTDEWATLEAAGCVFLPAAGSRAGTSVSGVNSYGYYWSSTAAGDNSAYEVIIGSAVRPLESTGRDVGCLVRLVREVE